MDDAVVHNQGTESASPVRVSLFTLVHIGTHHEDEVRVADASDERDLLAVRRPCGSRLLGFRGGQTVEGRAVALTVKMSERVPSGEKSRTNTIRLPSGDHESCEVR